MFSCALGKTSRKRMKHLLNVYLIYTFYLPHVLSLTFFVSLHYGSEVKVLVENTGVRCHFLLQGIFLIQGSNLVSCIQADSLPSEPPGNPHTSNYLRGLFFQSTGGLILFLSVSSSQGAPSGSSCSS